ncbi:MAG: HAD hydrolase-like protein, partial [Clostridia bacterium]|nr:HAD hydrolase-like protein [Clostridia bacterium]
AGIDGISDFKKEKAVWIGDSLTADIRAANEAGIDSVWLNFSAKAGAGNALPTYTAKSFAQVLRFLGIN